MGMENNFIRKETMGQGVMTWWWQISWIDLKKYVFQEETKGFCCKVETEEYNTAASGAKLEMKVMFVWIASKEDAFYPKGDRGPMQQSRCGKV